MIPNQRHLFNIPDDVAYLNCAFTSPLLGEAVRSGREAVRGKENPWCLKPAGFFSGLEEVRGLFSRLIGCDANCVAIIPSVSYGVALAARNLSITKGQSVVVLQDQFPSNIYSWRRLTIQKNAILKAVERSPDNDWTTGLLEAIENNTAIVALPHCHWTDGTKIGLVRVAEKCRCVGAALVIDGTQSLGAMPFPFEEVQPDFLMTTAHKWLLGPYSFGFCYVAPTWHEGVPLEENWLNRAGSEDFAGLVRYQDDYQEGARRFDMGEASNFFLSPVAATALNQLLAWGVQNIADTLYGKTTAIAKRAKEMGLLVASREMRSPHMIGVLKPGGFNPDLPNLLAKEKVFVSVRGESIRISPHVYNSDEDIDRLFLALKKAM